MNEYEEYDDDATSVQGNPAETAAKPLNKDQKSAIAAALVGTAALGGAAYGMSRFLDDSGEVPVAQETPPPTDHSADTDGSGSGLNDGLGNANALSVSNVTMPAEVMIETTADHNRDDMTFEEAFADARGDMGPGNYFEWHGNLYNTFFKDEWDGMSPNEHRDFLATVYGPDSPEAGGGGGAPGGGGGGDVMAAASTHAAAAATVAVADVPPPIESDGFPDITVEEPAHDNVHAVANVTVETDAPVLPGSDPNAGLLANADVAMAELDGNQVSVFDSDRDGRPDAIMDHDNVVLIDTDHDQVLDTRATYDPQTHQLSGFEKVDQPMNIDGSMETLHNLDNHASASIASSADFGADYNPDADITDYVA